MGIFEKIEEIGYKIALMQIFNPLMDRTDKLPEKEVREFFKTILDAAERALRGILFMAPSERDFATPPSKRDKTFWEKTMEEKSAFYRVLTPEEINFWLNRVSLALLSYSYYFNFPILKQNKLPTNFLEISYKTYWERMYYYYNQIFNENITQKEIDYYASGVKESKERLKEDKEKECIESDNVKKVAKLFVRDCTTIGAELLKKIWNQNINLETLESLKRHKLGYKIENPLANKIFFVGDRIWKAYLQIVQPFLVQLLNI